MDEKRERPLQTERREQLFNKLWNEPLFTKDGLVNRKFVEAHDALVKHDRKQEKAARTIPALVRL